MKKIGALALSTVVFASMITSVNAHYREIQTDVSNIKYVIPTSSVEHKLDGIISDGEYKLLEYQDSFLSYRNESNDENFERTQNDIDAVYLSYDEDYVYIAAEAPAEGHFNPFDETPGEMWSVSSIQLSLAAVNETDPNRRLEVGYGKSSVSDNLLFYNWCDGMGIAYDAKANNDFIVVVGEDVVTYEVRIPYEAFVEQKLEKGDQFLFSIVWVSCYQEGEEWKYTQKELGYGVSLDKDPAGHATITLGATAEEATQLPGDINGDGKLDFSDVVRLFQYSMMRKTYPITYVGNVDFNHDGFVDIKDAKILWESWRNNDPSLLA